MKTGLMAALLASGIANANPDFERGGIQVFPLVEADFEVEIEPGQGNSFSITSQRVWASAFGLFATAPSPDCDCAGENFWVDGMADSGTSSASAEFYIFPCSVFGVQGAATSMLTAGSQRIYWHGEISGERVPVQFNDVCSSIEGGGFSVGFEVEFTSTGSIMIPAPECPVAVDSQSARTTTATLYCSNGVSVSPAYVTQMNGVSNTVCPTGSFTIEPGSRNLKYFTISIDDEKDDVTGDMRFNQDDVDFLNSIVGTADATDDLYTSRFDFDEYFPDLNLGEVDAGDVELIQCFVDACLDARRIGDADCDNDIDCDDLTFAVAQSFSGEDFTGSTYHVGFDTDLDGDNDATDKVEIRNRFLAVEPAEYVLDGVLNFFDNSAFLVLYNNNDPLADVNGDSNINFFDVPAFLTAYQNPNCLAPGT